MPARRELPVARAGASGKACELDRRRPVRPSRAQQAGGKPAGPGAIRGAGQRCPYDPPMRPVPRPQMGRSVPIWASGRTVPFRSAPMDVEHAQPYYGGSAPAAGNEVGSDQRPPFRSRAARVPTFPSLPTSVLGCTLPRDAGTLVV